MIRYFLARMKAEGGTNAKRYARWTLPWLEEAEGNRGFRAENLRNCGTAIYPQCAGKSRMEMESIVAIAYLHKACCPTMIRTLDVLIEGPTSRLGG